MTALAFRPRRVYQTSPQGLTALTGAIARGQSIYLPKPKLTLSEWADRYAYIPPEAGAYPGKFHTDFAEYQRGIQDAITDSANETVVMMMCAQSGKTQIQMNAMGYFTHWEPSPILVVQASLGEAEKFSKNRISKMIKVTPVLRRIYPSPRARDSGNTLLNKEFPGGVLILAGANAPAGLASMPIRVLIPDEVDRYDESAGTEGDPVDLATKRTTTFWNRKILPASTPGIKHLSRIEKAYESSDKRKFFVPCPHCGEMQTLEWKRLRWKDEAEVGRIDGRARVIDWFYVCLNGCEIREQEKHEMIRRGEWRATARSHDGKTAGFHLNALYSPVLDWIKLIQEWKDAQSSLERMKTFINTRLAETWEVRGKGADQHELEKRERFGELLPSGVLFLTAGVDTQDNRLECTVWGWGLDDERWAVEHRVFEGDPGLPESDPASPWKRLREYMLEPFEHSLGVTMPISCVLIDSGGHNTQRVYDFADAHRLRRWFAIVGRAGWGRPLVNSGSETGPKKIKLYSVGTDTAKEDVFTSFRGTDTRPAYCYFSENLPPEYFRQLTAEKLVTSKQGFETTLQWVKTAERNEALDCAVYARAAVAVLKPNFRKVKRNLDRMVSELQAKRTAPAPQVPLGAPIPPAAEPKPEPNPAEPPTPSPAPKPAEDNGRPRPANFPRPRRAPGFVSGWRG
jgi:phage terminase large subunit GpA-like protein